MGKCSRCGRPESPSVPLGFLWDVWQHKEVCRYGCVDASGNPLEIAYCVSCGDAVKQEKLGASHLCAVCWNTQPKDSLDHKVYVMAGRWQLIPALRPKSKVLEDYRLASIPVPNKLAFVMTPKDVGRYVRLANGTIGVIKKYDKAGQYNFLVVSPVVGYGGSFHTAKGEPLNSGASKVTSFISDPAFVMTPNDVGRQFRSAADCIWKTMKYDDVLGLMVAEDENCARALFRLDGSCRSHPGIKAVAWIDKPQPVKPSPGLMSSEFVITPQDITRKFGANDSRVWKVISQNDAGDFIARCGAAECHDIFTPSGVCVANKNIKAVAWIK